MSTRLTCVPAVLQIAPLAIPQIAYCLLQIAGDVAPVAATHYLFLVDASQSMRIPIADEALFRQLVQRGGAFETLVDGVPVWQLAEALPNELRRSLPSALSYASRALHAALERLGAQDHFSLVAFGDGATLVCSGPASQRAELAHAIDRIDQIDAGTGTNMVAGLAHAHSALRGAPTTLRPHILLITDGFAENHAACEEQAAVLVAAGATISTLGVGSEFHELLLTTLADRSGGQALMVRDVARIPDLVAADLQPAGSLPRSVTITPSAGVQLRRVTPLRPVLGTPREPAAGEPARIVLNGATAHEILLELLLPIHFSGCAATIEAVGGNTIPLLARSGSTPPPARLVAAVGAATAARIQQRALARAADDPHGAAQQLTAAAQRFAALGAADLAAAAHAQAQQLTATGRLDQAAAKDLTYATRRLQIDEAG